MIDKKIRIWRILSISAWVLAFLLLAAAGFSLDNDIKRLENRVTELEDRQKFIEYRLIEMERPNCLR